MLRIGYVSLVSITVSHPSADGANVTFTYKDNRDVEYRKTYPAATFLLALDLLAHQTPAGRRLGLRDLGILPVAWQSVYELRFPDGFVGDMGSPDSGTVSDLILILHPRHPDCTALRRAISSGKELILPNATTKPKFDRPSRRLGPGSSR